MDTNIIQILHINTAFYQRDVSWFRMGRNISGERISIRKNTKEGNIEDGVVAIQFTGCRTTSYCNGV